MLTLTFLLLAAAFVCALISLAGKMSPAVLLLCVLEALHVLPIGK